MSRTLRVRGVAVALLLSLSSGCFRYVRTDVGPVPQGENVRVRVTQEGMTELRDLSSEPVVTGFVMSWGADEIMLRVPAQRGPQVAGETIGQDVRIPTRAIVELERRRVDGVRTALVAGLGFAAIGVAIVTIMGDAFGGDDLEPPGPDVQTRIPLGR
jgi:hypothetical protein